MKLALFTSILALLFAITMAKNDSSPRLSNLRRKLETGPDSTVDPSTTQKPPSTAAELQPIKVEDTAPSAIDYIKDSEMTSDILTIAKAISSQAMILDTKTAMDATEIADYLPHHHPFLFVDQVVNYDLEGMTIIGTKTVTVNEPHFAGSFPNNAKMPGVLQLEALAQLAEILLRKMPKIAGPGKSISLISLDGADLKGSVVPGKIIVMQVTVSKVDFKRATAVANGRAYVDGELVVEIDNMLFEIPSSIKGSVGSSKQKAVLKTEPGN